MKVFKLSLIFLVGAFLITSCNQIPSNEISGADADSYAAQQGEADFYETERRAKENLDLQAVAALIERANNLEEFEYLLNSENGVNNLDLNEDGYVDYISVSEFEDRTGDERGLSLFTKFGPDVIREIATVIFDRDRLDAPGARILLTGDEELYGDDYNYETNWLDRSLSLVSWLFSERDGFYNSPYDYENYPSDYEAYPIVETPVYRTRIEQDYPAPTFYYTNDPTVTEIKIKSPYHNRSADKFYSKLAKKEAKEFKKAQKEFLKNNPDRPDFAPVRKGWMKNFSKKQNKRPKRDWNDFDKPRKEKFEKFERREKPNKMMKENQKPEKFTKREMKPSKQEKSRKQKGGGKKN